MVHSASGINTRSFAYKLLKKQGWNEGQGLGPKAQVLLLLLLPPPPPLPPNSNFLWQGLATHVRVTKKNDNIGIGAKYRC
jgi:hypothetical protein